MEEGPAFISVQVRHNLRDIRRMQIGDYRESEVHLIVIDEIAEILNNFIEIDILKQSGHFLLTLKSDSTDW